MLSASEASIFILAYGKDKMNIDYNLDPEVVKSAAEPAIEGINKNGIYWFNTTRVAASAICEQVREHFNCSQIFKFELPPLWEHVIVDSRKLSDWSKWLKSHAEKRAQLSEDGIPDSNLPSLPYDITPSFE